ncbi:hypothetical protein SAMN05216355_101654 [Actinomyces ruminicola]|uniref:Uncharacterized protein n=1 Tax=Actinomyces ruminicola TaxID=332524 RepID=A0A1H0AA96_9ACTO|nr:hypothetical protein [Actinomyces ruminicola]SDN30385.1 hypothetical protein SAMN05216355_101654 [Actinomyces ruminicola]
MTTSHAFDPDGTPVGAPGFPAPTDQAFQATRWAELIGPRAIEEIRTLSPLSHTNSGWVGAYLHLARGARAAGKEFDAVVYERAAQFLMPGDDPRQLPIRERFVELMRQRFDLSPVRVPCDGAALPAYDLPARGLGAGGSWPGT